MWGDVKKAKETVQKYDIPKEEQSPQQHEDLVGMGNFDRQN